MRRSLRRSERINTRLNSLHSFSSDEHDMAEVTNATLLARLELIESSIQTTVTSAVTSAVTTALNDITIRVTNTENRVAELEALVKKMDAHYKKRIIDLEDELDATREELEDQQQRSRKYNVRIENIPFVGEPKNETDEQRWTKIVAECAKVDINITPEDVVRHHRTSNPTEKNGKMQAQTIVKLSNWSTRKKFQSANGVAKGKKVHFYCLPNLARHCHQLLLSARGKILSAMNAKFP